MPFPFTASSEKRHVSSPERLTHALQGDDATKWNKLPKFVCGRDHWQGQEEVRQRQEQSSRLNVSTTEGQRDLHLPSTPGPAVDAPPPGSAADHALPFKVPHPQHQTFSSTIAKELQETCRERSQMRIVVKDVGRPLDQFTSMHELVRAVLAAIEGHRTALESAGTILHRDVNLGNILVSSDPTPSSSGASVSDASRKERTGNYQFMAMEILEEGPGQVIPGVHHDLESIYWVLLWIVLRHTRHSLGQAYYKTIFKFGSRTEGANCKNAWFFSNSVARKQLVVEGNAPLSTLLRDFKALIYRASWVIEQYEGNRVLLESASILAIFRKAIEDPEQWPKDDIVPCTLVPEKVAAETAVVSAPGVTAFGADSEDDDEDDVDVDFDNSLPEEEVDDNGVDLADGMDEDGASDYAHPVANAPPPDNIALPHDNTPPADGVVPATPGPWEQQQISTRPQLKRSAAAAALPVTTLAHVPGPSGSDGYSKRRRTDSEQPSSLSSRGGGGSGSSLRWRG
ncbi:hypothetical protein L226DRAFT_616630 [Lentinus tigrinus ALCF2SS1-7]|uniref:Fungal-type protein kinase domain-containing protein n=1 Tax=Lentinus tigrinus ALCF2SS1-6 TaxID=1328759 RepID=A0A5C2RWT2_9APHY|nr:hypothetical protein L227DRAFT_657177 [Lentinus tigrinus ALCF2SS1-6]RPD69688.1 hypothetical protein L226DRAFT_616630 [Lentinus tigrinus ALCF2SS1-7]